MKTDSYKEIEKTGKTMTLWSDKQAFLNTVYERFFQGYSAQTADTMGIVYTPQPIVDWMVSSVERVLSQEWGKSLSSQGVHVLDPCTGTGNFLVNVLGRINPLDIERKFKTELWANEIMLLPYYIAAGNIEHEYHERTGDFEAFPGLCFADTLDLFSGAQLSIKEFEAENAERVEREMAAPITVILGNPPYNVGQKNENDNNKNRPYPKLDASIKNSYAKASRASSVSKIYDPYVRFFKWASERLNKGDGAICFITNNSFVKKEAFDGMRYHLGKEFNHIWHLDLGGDARSEKGGNIFDIMIGVGITILAKNSSSDSNFIRYHRVSPSWNKLVKLEWIKEAIDCTGVEWQELTPNPRNAWLTEGLQEDFETFLPLGSKSTKTSFSPDIKTVFRSYSLGLNTNRDAWMYDFSAEQLGQDMNRFIEFYNSEIERWKTHPKKTDNFDDFVSSDLTKIKWSSTLKERAKSGRRATYNEKWIRSALYRPFCKQNVYFDTLLLHRPFQLPRYFPKPESQNRLIVVSDISHRSSFSVLMTDCIPDLHLCASSDGFQCFPFYTYSSATKNEADSTKNESENITSYALSQFRAKYGDDVSKWDIFHYVYALLHHPLYRARYAENLKRDLPRVPLLELDFAAFARIGKELGDLHVDYENAPELASLKLNETREKGKPTSFRVEKMKWSADKTILTLNSQLALSGFTQDLFDYKLGNRAALDWIVESYRVKNDERSGLSSDPNRADNPQYIVRLVRRVAFVARETSRLVSELGGFEVGGD